jgi:hypothetical protein
MFIKKESLMKFLNSSVAILALLAIGSVNAKQMGAKTAAPAKKITPAVVEASSPKPLPTPTPTVRHIEKRLAAQIDKMNSLLEMNNNATQSFISIMQESSLPSNVKKDYLNFAKRVQESLTVNSMNNKNKIATAPGMGLISTTKPNKPALFEGLEIEQ